MKSGQIKLLVFAVGKALLGEKAVHRMLLARAYRHYERAGIIFIHIPKCAGTSVSRSLYGQSLGHRTARELRLFAPERFERLDSFAVLRDPLDRAYSAYVYLLRGGTKSGWAAPRPEYEDESFATFDRFATEWLPGRDARELDYVLRPQSHYVTDGRGKVIVDRLLTVDSLEESWPEIIRGHSVNGRKLRALNAQEDKPPLSPSEAVKSALRKFYAVDFALWESIQPKGERS